MPRPRDPVWDSFDREPNPNGKIEIAKCRLCDWKQIGLVERLKAHLAKRHSDHPAPQAYTTRASRDRLDESSSSDVVLLDKVAQLEEALKKFRAEVDLKMTIVEQVLTTRNELFTAQKKLLDREHALHENVLAHWKNISELAANGLSLQFADNASDIDLDCRFHNSKSTSLGKGQPAKATAARRERRKRLKLRHTSGEVDSEDGDEAEDEANTSGDHEDGETSVPEGLEKKVFVKFYSEEDPQPGERVTRTPVWKYYLREENGDSALCKICDEEGVQSILKVRDCSTSSLHTHLKFKHKIVLEPSQAKAEADGAVGDGQMSPPKRGRVGNGNIGRPASQVWSYFTEFILDGQRKQQCLKCGQLVSAQAPRLIRHYENCRKNNAAELVSESSERRLSKEEPPDAEGHANFFEEEMPQDPDEAEGFITS